MCNGKSHVVDGRRRRGEVVDDVNRLVDDVRFGDVDVECTNSGSRRWSMLSKRPDDEVVDARSPRCHARAAHRRGENQGTRRRRSREKSTRI